jgi:hypothetical protein
VYHPTGTDPVLTAAFSDDDERRSAAAPDA